MAASALKERLMSLTEFTRSSYTINAELGTTPEDLLVPSFWAHTAWKFKPLDLLEARAEDGSWYAQLLVRDKGKSWAKVVMLPGFPLMFEDIIEVPDTVIDDYTIKWSGPQNKFRVIRNMDKHVMKEGFTNKEEARKWLLEHMKAFK